ncbi:DNA repair protein RecO [Allofustis seminis]|uniref:DNA repair protein RecO n=1 Tax=Allofustis seminis TaxID=166939 RepID=UPI00037DCB54|nr:DNA repair protein RecO [Allofustis seminis]
MLEKLEGVVLFKKPHREKDFLVKILTNMHGPLMFFVRGSYRKDALDKEIYPLVRLTFEADVRREGLSFIRAINHCDPLPHLHTDIKKNAYGIYFCMLTDAALADREANSTVYSELIQALTYLNEDVDAEIISCMYELKRLKEFGVMPNWLGCALCHKTEGIFDYSSKYHGIICSQHFVYDKRRFHANPKAIYLLRQLNYLKFDQLGKINVTMETKKEMKHILNKIYDETVGIKLKSKHFIQEMEKYETFFEDEND